MARHEEDREDLMAQAVALTERTELAVPGFDEFITVGFRATGAISVFFGQDPVYQFDPSGRLRRAFRDGFLYRSQHQTLARLARQRTETQTLLLRTDLNSQELDSFRGQMAEVFQRLVDAIQCGNVTVVQVFPPEQNLLPRITISLQQILGCTDWLSTAIRRRG